MYKDFFGLTELPFTIVPSSRYIFLSARHREAMNHLQAGLNGGGGFALLTGEVGTGKTTVSKALLSVLDENIKTGLILNPTYTSNELLESICDEFSVEYPESASLKQLTQLIYQYLLDNHAQGIQTVLLIDEAQHLSADVLEQLRLLTNLETESQKLLRVLLIGQPELQYKLQTEELRQLAQRITGRYHLLPLTPQEVAQYIQFRLQVAGCRYEVFSSKAVKEITKQTNGVPRLINLVCDKCMLYAYYGGVNTVSGSIAEKACEDIMTFQRPINSQSPQTSSNSQQISVVRRPVIAYTLSLAIGLALAGGAWWGLSSTETTLNQASSTTQELALALALAPTAINAKPQLQATVNQPVEELSQTLDVEQIIQPLVSQAHNPISAMKTLFALWGYQVANAEANCRDAERANLRCYQHTGTLANLSTINRPVMLTMQDNYRTYFAVLYRLKQDSAELLVAGERVEVPLEWLTDNWSGEFQLLWHTEIAAQTLKLNSQGEDVVTLNRLLSQVLGEPLTTTNVFDQSVHSKVEAFQMWQGIMVDGVVGKETLMLLDSYVNTDAPVIISKPAAKEAL